MRKSPTARRLAAELPADLLPARKRSPQPRRRPATPLAAAFRHLRPNWRHYVDYVAMAASEGDDEMAAVMRVYNSLKRREQAELTPERLCDLASIKPSVLVGAVCEQVWAAGLGESTVVAAIEHPRVMLATARRAQLPDGKPDAELFLRATGSLPDKKGAAVTINNNPASIAAAFQASTAAQGEPQDAPHPQVGFRSMVTAVSSLDRLLKPQGGAPLGTPVPTAEEED